MKTLGVLLCGDALDVRDWHGHPITDETFLMLLNASHEAVDFVLPRHGAKRWATIIDTANERGFVEREEIYLAGQKLPLLERSFVLLRRIS